MSDRDQLRIRRLGVRIAPGASGEAEHRGKMPEFFTTGEYLTTAELADELGYHVESVRRLIRCGKLKGRKKGIWLVRREDLEGFKEAIEGKSKHDPTRGP